MVQCTCTTVKYEVKTTKVPHTTTLLVYLFNAFTMIYIEDITRRHEDMNFILSGKTIFYSLAVLVRKILFLPRENNIHIFKPPCRVMFILLYRQNNVDTIIEGNYKNYVIDKLTCEIMENKPLGSRM